MRGLERPTGRDAGREATAGVGVGLEHVAAHGVHDRERDLAARRTVEEHRRAAGDLELQGRKATAKFIVVPHAAQVSLP